MSRRTVAKSKNNEIGSLVVRNIKKIVRLTAESWAWTSGNRKAITDLFLVFIAWTNQKASHVPKLLSQIWHEDNLSSCERYKIKTSKALGKMHVSTSWSLNGNDRSTTVGPDSCRFDIGRFRAKPTNYERRNEHRSDAFAYRSAHNNLLPPYATRNPQVKKDIERTISTQRYGIRLKLVNTRLKL